jgi:GTP-binding protein
MLIKTAEFVKSSTHLKDCPQSMLPEYAFIGRSNVGKSSLINMLTGHSKLAKISATPGKTQLINHFIINNSWYLTDLPGFGFAKVSKKLKENWEKMIRNYLLKRENLVCTFLLVDSRHGPQKNDLEFMEWMGASHIPFVIVFTKTDKTGKAKLDANLATYRKTLSEQWEPLPDMFISSSEKNTGKEEILDFIDRCNSMSHGENQ